MSTMSSWRRTQPQITRQSLDERSDNGVEGLRSAVYDMGLKWTQFCEVPCCHLDARSRATVVLPGPEWSELEGVAAIGGHDLLDVRVAQLESGTQPKLAALSLTNATVSLMGVALFASTFLASVFSFGGPTAVYKATGTGLRTVDLLSGLACAAPVAGAGLVAYWLIAKRASRPLTTRGAR